jgi:transitional endoplasmic reticulum ATPase
MDGFDTDQEVIVMAATNRPDVLDPALLRPGRFDELVYVGVPDAAGRARILRIQTQKMPLAEDVDLDAIAARAERYTGADLEDVVRRAGLIALRESLATKAVTQAHFEAALADSRATVTPEMEAEYEAMSSRLKQDAVSIQPIGFIAPGMVHGRGPKGEG